MCNERTFSEHMHAFGDVRLQTRNVDEGRKDHFEAAATRLQMSRYLDATDIEKVVSGDALFALGLRSGLLGVCF